MKQVKDVLFILILTFMFQDTVAFAGFSSGESLSGKWESAVVAKEYGAFPMKVTPGKATLFIERFGKDLQVRLLLPDGLMGQHFQGQIENGKVLNKGIEVGRIINDLDAEFYIGSSGMWGGTSKYLDVKLESSGVNFTFQSSVFFNDPKSLYPFTTTVQGLLSQG